VVRISTLGVAFSRAIAALAAGSSIAVVPPKSMSTRGEPTLAIYEIRHRNVGRRCCTLRVSIGGWKILPVAWCTLVIIPSYLLVISTVALSL
jgi:hypothetical protein